MRPGRRGCDEWEVGGRVKSGLWLLFGGWVCGMVGVCGLVCALRAGVVRWFGCSEWDAVSGTARVEIAHGRVRPVWASRKE